jgi:membrane peptidoglycan carboxypeptidase
MITRRRRERAKKRRPKYLAILGWASSTVLIAIFTLIFFIMGTGVALAYSVYASFAIDLPDPSAIETEQDNFETTKLYDRTGKVVLYELFDPRLGDRAYVPLEQIPEHCRNAVIVLEDKNFYSNPGFDVQGLTRAFVSNLQGNQVQGGSSITQQLIKNIIIEEEERALKSYNRKIKEVILAVEITRLYEKNQILEWYFNTNYYGNLAYGIQAAAQVYYQKDISELSLAECTMLAPIPQFPALNPLDNPDDAKQRQGITLTRLVEEGLLTKEEAEATFAEEVEIKRIQERFDILAPHFSIYARDQLLELRDEDGEILLDPVQIYRGGLKVYTTVDLTLNDRAREIAAEQIAVLQENENNASNACVVSIRPKTGEILAMVGSIDYWDQENDGNVNVCAANPGRQPGSSFKPFNYVTALEKRIVTPATMIMDVRQSFPDAPNPPYVPENYDRTYHGPVSLRNALARSYNIPAVWVMEKSGVKDVIEMSHRLGITTLNEDYYGLALTLGGGEVKPIDMAYAYSTMANLGVMAGKPRSSDLVRPGHRTLDPVAILRVEATDGTVLYEYRQPQNVRVLDEALAYVMVNIMSDDRARAPAFGANSDLTLPDRPVAAKTGTTNNFRDNWTIGFTPQLATVVWVGNNDNEPMEDVTGLSGAAPIWNQVMAFYHQDKDVEVWQQPPGVVRAGVDARSGLRPTPYSLGPVYELFLDGTEPTQEDNVHQVFAINRENGKLAVAGCTPPELVEERVYEIYPPVANDWVTENNIPQPPFEYDDQCNAAFAGPVAITGPRQFSYVQGGVVITGNARLDGFQLYRLEFGRGLNPTEWTQIGPDHFDPVDNGPLEIWDTTALEEGLYTLQLTALRGDSSFDRFATQITIDKTPPATEIINPEPERSYIMEDDEYINLQVDAEDNFAMDRVEYYFNNQKVAETTVAPYSIRWPIEMRDTPIGWEEPRFEERPILGPDGQVTGTEVFTISTVAPVLSQDRATLLGYTKTFSGGFQIIQDTGGYTESHLIHVVAIDAAGNKTESEKVRVYVAHEREEEEEEARSEPVAGPAVGSAVARP